MSLYYYGPGNWSIGNVRLPELGVSELFGGDKQSLRSSTLRNINVPTKTSYPTTDNIYQTRNTVYTPSQSANKNYSYTRSLNVNTNPDPQQNYLNDLRRNEVVNREGDLKSIRDQIIKQADSMYKSAERNYRSRLGELESTRNEMQSVLERSFNDQIKRIEGGRQNQIEQLDNARNLVDTNQKNTFRELANNTASALQAANQGLGAYGASDSNATNMYVMQ